MLTVTPHLMEILKANGVPVEIADAVNMMYTNTTAPALSPDGDTEFFEILAGVLQGLGRYSGTIFIRYCRGICHETSSWERKQPRIHSRWVAQQAAPGQSIFVTLIL